MKRLAILLLPFLTATHLFAFKDAFYLGATTGVVSGESENDVFSPAGSASYDKEADITGFQLGNDFRFERSARLKGRWELSYQTRDATISQNGVETETEGYRTAFSFMWGYDLGVMLNNELVPFFKLGYGLSEAEDESITNAYDIALGVGMQFITKYLDVGVGVDYESRNYDGWKLSYLPLTEGADETEVATYLSVNIRLY